MIQWLSDAVLANWGELSDGQPRPRRLVAAQYGHSGHPTSAVVVFLFPPGARDPVVVAKVPRTPGGAEALRAEATALQQVQSELRETDLSGALPRRALLLEEAGLTALIQSFAPGAPMASRSRWRPWVSRRRIAGDFAIAGRWLTEFQRITQCGSTAVGEDDGEKGMQGVASACEGQSALSATERRGLERARAVAAELKGAEVPLVRRHGDFSVVNLLLHGRRLSVVDWRHSRPAKSPLFDALTFATTYGFEVLHTLYRPMPAEKAVATAYFSDSSLARSVRDFVDAQCTRLGAPVGLAGASLPLVVAKLATREKKTSASHPQYDRRGRAILRVILEGFAAAPASHWLFGGDSYLA